MVTVRYGQEAFPFGSSVLAIGFFDGVHTAHRNLIRRAISEGRRLGVPAGVFTFSSEGNIKSGVKRIYTTEEKLSLIESLGADFTVVASFADIAGMGAREFCTDVLLRELGCRCAVVGYNFRFGKGAFGDSEMLSDIMTSHGANTVICPAELYLGEPISSSGVRRLIEAGNVAEAARLLGAPYFIDGEVVHGNGVGQSVLGIPTVNITFREGLVTPARGVYRVGVLVGVKLLAGVCNVGACPTFGERDVHAEVHIVDFSGDLYGKNVRVYFLDFLREERRFGNENELKMQIEVDKKRAITEMGDIKWIIAGQN